MPALRRSFVRASFMALLSVLATTPSRALAQQAGPLAAHSLAGEPAPPRWSFQRKVGLVLMGTGLAFGVAGGVLAGFAPSPGHDDKAFAMFHGARLAWALGGVALLAGIEVFALDGIGNPPSVHPKVATSIHLSILPISDPVQGFALPAGLAVHLSF